VPVLPEVRVRPNLLRLQIRSDPILAFVWKWLLSFALARLAVLAGDKEIKDAVQQILKEFWHDVVSGHDN
jgi:hypothetical protein